VNIYEETSSAPRQLGDSCTLKNISKGVWCTLKTGCCYITVDFASAASQNKFRTFNFSCHKKITIIKKNVKNFTFLLLSSFIIEKSSLCDTFVEFHMQTLFCDTAISKSIVVRHRLRPE
jgi:hypothetical protein